MTSKFSLLYVSHSLPESRIANLANLETAIDESISLCRTQRLAAERLVADTRRTLKDVRIMHVNAQTTIDQLRRQASFQASGRIRTML